MGINVVEKIDAFVTLKHALVSVSDRVLSERAQMSALLRA